MKTLINEAARMGVRVHLAHIDGDELGFYDDREKEIVVRLGMTTAQTKETLAHELGHAYFGHIGTKPAYERLADRWAAGLLVDPEMYMRAERINPHPNAIAAELGLTPHIVHMFEKNFLTAIGNTVYTRPRMGLGQWSLKVSNG